MGNSTRPPPFDSTSLGKRDVRAVLEKGDAIGVSLMQHIASRRTDGGAGSYWSSTTRCWQAKFRVLLALPTCVAAAVAGEVQWVAGHAKLATWPTQQSCSGSSLRTPLPNGPQQLQQPLASHHPSTSSRPSYRVPVPSTADAGLWSKLAGDAPRG